ncbi:MAG TPA: nitrate- and nitrite sensing domain-containing protein [Streptosporangiaceae bacterium]|nr:nitrate- and nitrite sensing domain-containing protein [Streptosporangiaceae bacterium]
MLGLYGFVLYTTVGDAINLDRAPALINATSVPAAQFNINIQNERKASLVYLVAPTAASKAALAAAQNATAQAFPSFQAKMTGAATTDAATTAELTVIRQMLNSVQGLSKIRPAVTARAIQPTEVFNAFSNILAEEVQLFVKENSSLTNASAATGSLAIINSTESGEFMSQEDALVSAALAAHDLTRDTRIQVTQLAGARRAMLQAATSRLSNSDLAVFNNQLNKYAPASVQNGLTTLENAIAADTSAFPPFTATQWDPVLKGMSSAIFFAGVNSVENEVKHDHTITNAAWRRVALSGGLGLLGLILSVLLSVLIGRRIVRRLDRLQGSVETLANQELPDVVARLRRGEDVPVENMTSIASDLGRDEIGRVGRAFDAARHTAVEAAVGEARMRRGVNDVFRNLARRNQSLLHRELTVLDGMERRTTDPEQLEDLFRLDHLTTRMRRHSEGLIILSGAAPGRGWVHPVRMIDVLRAAAAEVEDYSRVTVTTPSQAALTGPAVADVIHLLAELIENATTLSPPYTPVRVSGDMAASGFAVEIEDRGLGMGEPRYAELNHRLENPPEFDVFNSEQLGLFVVGQLAKRHGIRVTLRPSPYGGTTAIALIPNSLVGTDDGFMEGLPAGASGPAPSFPAAEPSAPAQLTGGPSWGALPQGNGNGPGAVPNGNGAALAGPDGPADPFDSYTSPNLSSDPYAAAGNGAGNGAGGAGNGASDEAGFGWLTPNAEQPASGDQDAAGPPDFGSQPDFGSSPEVSSPEEAPPFGTISDGPSETGLPWPYDRPAPAGNGAPAGTGAPSFTPNDSYGPPEPSFTPNDTESGYPAPRSPFPPAPFPGGEPPYQPPQPPTGPPSPYPGVPAAEDAPPARTDSRPSLPLRRRSGSRQTAAPQASQPPQFGSEPPSFSPVQPQSTEAQPMEPQFSMEQPQPRFTPEPAAPMAPEPVDEHPDGIPSDGGDYKGLPRRVRQANLAPQLRDAPTAAGSQPEAASNDNVANRSPDDIRSALSAMQRGWQQGRSVTGEGAGTGSVASGHRPPAEGEASDPNRGGSDEG